MWLLSLCDQGMRAHGSVCVSTGYHVGTHRPEEQIWSYSPSLPNTHTYLTAAVC